ncbi:MAG: MIP/aquaporin family protein [Hyphomicrobiales bacterium]
MTYSKPQQYAAEFIGTAFLLATVVGSGIMGEKLAGGSVGLALLCNTIPTGAILAVLITMLGPISGAHFNPAVTCVFAIRRDIALNDAAIYVGMQIAGGIAGVLAAHIMFEETIFQLSQTARSGTGQWFAEIVATFGLMFTILATLNARESFVGIAVGLYITAAYWFTASTSFANPAVTIARGFSDTFAGILPAHVPGFIVAQLVGAILAGAVCNWLLNAKTDGTSVETA